MSPLAINIGVSGHRDIPAKDWPKLKETLATELNSLKEQFPHSSINVLSGLAEGADQLMAHVALQLNFNLIGVLPFEIDEYEKDFATEESLEQFRHYLSQCSEITICRREAHVPRDSGYSELAKVLVQFSDLVIVLWDGVVETNQDGTISSPLAGGTADVVNMCLEGLVDDRSLLFSKPNKTFCKWLAANRERHNTLPATIGNPEIIGTWKPILLKGEQDIRLFNEILLKTERFNVNALGVKQEAKTASREFLLGPTSSQKDLAAINKLIDAYTVADCLAQLRQKQRLTSIKSITSLSFIAILAQQIYVSLYPNWLWFSLHLFLVIVAVGIYRIFFVGTDTKEEQFVEWRVFAEDLRVQIFWYLSGISDHCANYYRTTKLNEMDWIVDNLNKLMLNVVPPVDCDIAFVRQQWILDQRNYFVGQRGERGRAASYFLKAKRLQNTAIVLFCSAIILMFVSVIKVHTDFFPVMSTSVFFVIIAMLFITSALIKTFAVQMGFEELSQRYLRTGYYFQQAMDKLALLDRHNQQDTVAYQKIIKTIGIEALNENAAWLQLHKMNAYKVQVS
ncbi:hypothetical protein AX660_22050 [Paraglaciecola hydrolytica]|uniref:SMODS and SLOG-associating 2TM effector domain-containing protein n=2 Tax=Paraglaciecola hydrolytica TaxID=1799789 RepID=A0A148KM68_9ALTE|nr:hypothetical protein AX660_22050 [Paraglaciecola hydrolytica]